MDQTGNISVTNHLSPIIIERGSRGESYNPKGSERLWRILRRPRKNSRRVNLGGRPGVLPSTVWTPPSWTASGVAQEGGASMLELWPTPVLPSSFVHRLLIERRGDR